MMTAAQKKAFVARMAKARTKANARKKTKGVTRKNSSRTEVRSPTRTEVRSPTKTSTSTWADTEGNITVTGGAGDGDTSVKVYPGRAGAAGNPAGRTTKLKRHITFGKRSRGNPGMTEADVYEEFHGRPPREVFDIETNVFHHDKLAGLGKLVRLVIRTARRPLRAVTIGNFKGTLLACDRGKKQLFIEGGDQSVNLADFNITAPIHEQEVLGVLEWLFYDTVKVHLGKDGGDAIYKHWQRQGPTVVYNTRNKLLYLAGGVYEITPEGILK